MNVLVNQINAIPRTTDINWLKNNWYAQDGTTVTQASVDEAGKTGNLYWTVNKNKNTGTVDRMFGSAVISYKPVKGLSDHQQPRYRLLRGAAPAIYAWGTVGLPDGQFNTNNISLPSDQQRPAVSYDTTFGKDWSFKAMLGHNINQNFTKYLDVTAKNLLVADIYSYANAESVITNQRPGQVASDRCLRRDRPGLQGHRLPERDRPQRLVVDHAQVAPFVLLPLGKRRLRLLAAHPAERRAELR